MRSVFLYISLCIFSIASVFARTEISTYAEQRIDEFMQLRVDISSCDTNDEALRLIDEFEKETLKNLEIKAVDFDQECRIFESFYTMERHHYLYDNVNIRKQLCEAMKTQMEKNEAILSGLKDKEFANKWLYVLTGDVTSCYMTFSLAATLRYGFHVKDLYEKALEQDPGLSYCLTNIGQWMFYAPGIFGGGKKKAQKCFCSAVKNSRNDAEQFFSDIYMSQFYFDRKQKKLSKEYLEKASAYNTTSKYIDQLRMLNANGWSLFYFNRNRAGIEEDIKNSNYQEPVDPED